MELDINWVELEPGPVVYARGTARFLGAQASGARNTQYLQLGASVGPLTWRSRGWTSPSGALKANILVWEMLLHEMAKPGRVIRWEHVPTHVNIQGNKVANGLALEGMCNSPLWSRLRR